MTRAQAAALIEILLSLREIAPPDMQKRLGDKLADLTREGATQGLT